MKTIIIRGFLMSIKAIIFDFFGVISTEVSPFWFAERFSEEEAKALKDKYMTPADRGDLTEEEVFLTLSELSGESPTKIEADFASRVKIDKEMTSLIESLRGDYKTVLLSNAMGTWLWKILKANDLEGLFDTIVISSEEHVVKPDRRIFEIALKRLGVNADEAVFIDDNKKNADGALSVGINGIIYTGLDDLKNTLCELGVRI